jgi:V/A-type H+-transporting ATPase subunit I
MAISPVMKVQLLAHASIKDDLMSTLQEAGVIHIEQDARENLGLPVSAPDVSVLDHRLFKLKHAIDFLSPWTERSLAEKLAGQKPQVRLQEREQLLAGDHQGILDQVEALESEQNQQLTQIKFLEKEIEFLMPLESLDVPVRSLRSSETTAVRLGSLPNARWDELEAYAQENPLFLSLIQRDKRNSSVLLAIWKGALEEAEDELKDLGFHPLYFTEPLLKRAGEKDTVKDLVGKLRADIEAGEKHIEELQTEAKRLCRHQDELKRVYDVLLNQRNQCLSERRLGVTEEVFYLEGWVRSADEVVLQEKLAPYSDLLECALRAPLPEETYPIALENRRSWKPFEMITQLYGLPLRDTLDPTVFLAPFFFVFVGLAVSEAGYGLLVTLLCLLFIKLAKPKGGLRQFLILMMILGVSNVIFGTLVGGWFGFPIKKLLLLDPLQDPVRFLLLALALGFIQVWFGTFLELVTQFKQGNKAHAIFVQGGWLLLLPGLVLYGVTQQPYGGILALVGAAGIIFFSSPSRNPLARFFGGLYGLYGISGYLSDILSYSRLLALGLATTVIAMVVNTLCETALGIPWVGWLIAALIFVGGHLFNLAISFLGGFVHSMRLQFVEFFSKFFKSGGKPFRPYEMESKYVEFI